MKILFIHRTQGTGVEKVHIEGMANSWKKIGHDVTFFSPKGITQEIKQRKNQSISLGYLRKMYFQFISKKLPEFMFEIIEIIYTFKSLFKLRSLLKREKFDVIYERYAFFSILGAKISHKHRVPLIIEINYTSYDPLVRKRTKVLMNYCRKIEKRVITNAAIIVAVSSNLVNTILKKYSVMEDRILLLPNAADPTLFSQNISGDIKNTIYDLNSKKIIGFVGGFYPWHGLDMLLSAFEIVKDSIADVCLMLIGDGPEKNNIINLARKKKIIDSIIFTGKINHSDLPKYIRYFDIAVMPDSNNYGSPMKIFEYMSMGKVVIAPDYEPITDVINNYKNGVIFKRKRSEDLANAIIKLLSDEKLICTIGDKAKKLIIEKHNWDSNAIAVINKLERVV